MSNPNTKPATAWQPISTYPEQELWAAGPRVLLFDGEVKLGHRDCRTDDPDYPRRFWAGEWDIEPTHWMPLPEPPK